MRLPASVQSFAYAAKSLESAAYSLHHPPRAETTCLPVLIMLYWFASEDKSGYSGNYLIQNRANRPC